jgi:hypothetical protein
VTKSRGINRPKWRPTDEQRDVMRREFANTRTADLAERFGVHYGQVVKLASVLGLKKSEEFLNGPAGGRVDGARGAGKRFAPGHVPWSKGKKLPGTGGASTFKPGARPFNYKPVGSYRVGSGYLQRKVTETGYPPRDWVMVHRLVWEAEHGPVPEGCVVAFKAGRRTTELEQITPDAIELVSRREHMSRNSVNRLPKELADLVKLRGALSRQINKRSTTA